MGQKYKRSRLWVDPPFQFRLLLRMGFYLVLYSVVVWHLGFLFTVMVDLPAKPPEGGLGGLYLQYLSQQRALLYALVLTCPIFLYDLLKFSHRIAGPLYRCRQLMQQMADGQPVPEFTPRKRDLMRELFQTFNALIKQCNARAKEADEAHPAQVG